MAFGEQRTRALQCNSELRVDWKRCHWAGMHKGAAGFHLVDARVCNAHGFSSWSFFVPPLWIQIAECGNHVVINCPICHKTSLCDHHWGECKKFWEFFAKIMWIFSLSWTALCKSVSRADLGRGGQSKQLLFYYPDMFNFFHPILETGTAGFALCSCMNCMLRVTELSQIPLYSGDIFPRHFVFVTIPRAP